MDAATETPVVADAAVVQRKRGRPKKTDAPVAKKVLKSTTGNAANETNGEKIERRGRPKGVKNSPKAASKVAKEKAPKEKAPKKEKVSAPATGEKRKRGRPAKVDKEVAVEKPAKKAKTAAVGKKTKAKPATEDEVEVEVEEQVDGVEDAVEEKDVQIEDDGSIPAEAVSNNAADFHAPAEDESSVQEDVTLS